MRWPRSASDLALTLCLLLPSAHAAAADCVALLHGLWRGSGSMAKMQSALVEAGFSVRNVGYDSTAQSIADLAAEAVPRAVAACGSSPRIHFVTHSMGGILLRHYLETRDIDRLGRVVMLGPPNQGSEVIDFYEDVPAFEWFAGPAGLELGTGEASVPRALGPARFDVGVIAGTRSINWVLSGLLPDADDGKVSVAATRLQGMNDHVELPVTHVFMMRDPEVIGQVVHYLDHGRFRRAVH